MSMLDKNQPENEDHMWKTHMETLMRRQKMTEFDEKLRKAISDWYFEEGIPEPPWRQKKPYFDEDGNIIRPED